jgi:bacteriophage N4 adsorption protein B
MEFVENLFTGFAYVAVIGFLLTGLDDLFFDLVFLVYLARSRKEPAVPLQELKRVPEQWIAIFVPAWQEGGVVNKMAEYASRVADYEKYDIFVGVYPNDAETNACVDDVCATHPRIHKVVVPHPGPTSKADCLNWIYRSMRLAEVPGVKSYAIVAIQDAEDVIHPLTLKVYNYYVPRHYDMAQIPVFGLELPLRYWVGNTYIDDFAELHTKDLFIRECLGGVVPSAGVGTAFSRETLERLASENGHVPFHLNNLTEDYEIGIRIKRGGYRAGLVAYPVARLVQQKRPDGTPGPSKRVMEVVAIRENFPTTFRAAVRQRARWIMGISFQTWEQSGWAGTLPVRYTLLRDRRAPLTHLINVVGYVALAYVSLQWIFWQTPWAHHVYWRPLFATDSLLWKLTIVDTCLLAYRSLQRFISVQATYNTKQALCSIPRVAVGNIINFAATVRAITVYLGHKVFKQPVVWSKTSHVFPSEAVLSAYTKTVEDLLVEEGLVTRDQIADALQKVGAGSAPLCLLRLGLLAEKDFTTIWSRHSGLPVRFVNPYEVPLEVLRRFPETDSVERGAIPVTEQGGRLVMAFREPPTAGGLKQLSEQLGQPLEPVLAQPSNIEFSRHRVYPRLVLEALRQIKPAEPFRRSTALGPLVFLEALSSQHANRHSLPDVMVDMGLLAEPEARRLWAASLGCPPATASKFELNRDLYLKAGPVFWWLHRMLPVQQGTVLTAARPHPQLIDWLAGLMGTPPVFAAELPRKLELLGRLHAVQVNPDQLLLDALMARGLVQSADLPRIDAARALIADPLSTWLLLQRMVNEEELHAAFLEMSRLPESPALDPQETERLLPALPPGFPEETGCFCLAESAGAVRLGLAQLPTATNLHAIHDRLMGCSLFFHGVSYAASTSLRLQATHARRPKA